MRCRLERALARLIYPVTVVAEDVRREREYAGLCADCQFVRRMKSDRGSTFYFCERSTTDPAFPKYPRLPVLQCRGYQRTADEQPLDH